MAYVHEDGSLRLGWRMDGKPELGEVEDRSALAALALYGQPFGFTWEDVDALREAAGEIEGDDPDPFVYQRVGAVHAVAARIEALLPPREET